MGGMCVKCCAGADLLICCAAVRQVVQVMRVREACEAQHACCRHASTSYGGVWGQCTQQAGTQHRRARLQVKEE